MSRLKYDKISIWENKKRIKDLTFFRDLWLEGLFNAPHVLISPATGRPFSAEERRTELNQRSPAVREMVALADISALRDWRTFRKDDPPVRVDVLEQFWYIEKLRLSARALSDVVDEAIGKYLADQRGSWVRIFNPFHWFGRMIDWIVWGAFNVVALFGGNPQAARSSQTGHIVEAIGKLLLWFSTVGAFVIALMEFLGLQTPIRHFFHLP
jgi:hypothetical protein